MYSFLSATNVSPSEFCNLLVVWVDDHWTSIPSITYNEPAYVHDLCKSKETIMECLYQAHSSQPAACVLSSLLFTAAD